MSPEQVQSILADFANRATRLGIRADGAEIWRFDVEQNRYELHYWVDDNTAIRKYLGGARAGREFSQLQTLQKLTIPATRVIANLKGFRIGDRKGDACIVVRDANVLPLGESLRTGSLARDDRLRLTAQLITILEALHRAKLCPVPLTIDRFGVRRGQVIVLDGAGDFAGIVTPERLRELDRSTRLLTSAPERLRFWKHFSDEKPLGSRGDASDLVRDALRGNGDFERIAIDDWTGVYVRKSPIVLPWGVGSARAFDAEFWRAALPTLLRESETNAIKSDPAGIVGAVTVQVEGSSIELIVKRPAFKPGLDGWWKRIRRSRALRTWEKTWRLLGLGFPCELPLLVLQRRGLLGVKDQLIVFERVPGETFAKADLDAIDSKQRSTLLRACGTMLRKIEAFRFTHADAKNTNWIAWRSPDGRVRPVLIDLDGVRFHPWRGKGLARFLRAMKTHPQISDGDLRAIEDGYRNP